MTEEFVGYQCDLDMFCIFSYHSPNQKRRRKRWTYSRICTFDLCHRRPSY